MNPAPAHELARLNTLGLLHLQLDPDQGIPDDGTPANPAQLDRLNRLGLLTLWPAAAGPPITLAAAYDLLSWFDECDLGPLDEAVICEAEQT